MSGGGEDTIFALATGGLPSALAVVRVSGRRAGEALEVLTGRGQGHGSARPALLRDSDGEAIDRAVCLWFVGPHSATGEDTAEFHIHGSRAAAGRLLAVLGAMPGLRLAEAGEFTRRALLNGKIELSQVEALADLIDAETETQRRHALAVAEGGLAAKVAAWRETLLTAHARIEAVLDFGDEDDVGEAAAEAEARAAALRVADEIVAALASPPAERLRDGVRVAIAGPPNAGKSTLLNALIGRDAAIVSDIAGTTRDVIEAPAQIDGIALLFSDTAGLRESGDAIEAEGVRRARSVLERADIVLWLGDPGEIPEGAEQIAAKADLGGVGEGLSVSALTGAGLDALRTRIVSRAKALLPRDGEIALNARQRAGLDSARESLASSPADLVLFAESLRAARAALDGVSGHEGVEAMLDAIFARFCIGK